MPRTRACQALSLVAAVLLLGACTLDPYAGERSADPDPGTSSSATSPSAGTTTTAGSTPDGEPTTAPSGPVATSPGTTPGGGSATPAPSAGDGGLAPPFTADASPDEGEGTGSDVGTLVDLRAGGHEGFDRVVFELEGPDVPAWRVAYVDEAVGDPSGEAVDVDGAAVLQVVLDPVAYPEDGAGAYDGPSSVRPAGGGAVAEVVLSSIFEGTLQAFVGVEGGREPFRVYGMSDPARVVIEVQDP